MDKTKENYKGPRLSTVSDMNSAVAIAASTGEPENRVWLEGNAKDLNTYFEKKLRKEKMDAKVAYFGCHY